MSIEMIIVLIVLFIILVLFIWDRLRYDIVALLALLTIVIIGILPVDEAFIGFSHPAVITVVSVLVISQGLINSGIVDVIADQLSKIKNNTFLQMIVILVTVIILSAFMNNIGAIALLLPVTVRIAKKNNKSPSIFLIPLAFGGHLGGFITLIGTPSNLVVSSFREQYGIGPFNMFDFAPIGLGIAFVSMIFISLIGWRLIPQRKEKSSEETMLQIKEFLTEVRLKEDSKIIGKRIYEIEEYSSVDISIVAFIRDNKMIQAPSYLRTLQKDDYLIVKGSHEDLKAFVDDTKSELSENRIIEEGILGSDTVSVMEVVIGPNSILDRRTVKSIELYSNYGINLLAIAHREENIITRLKNIKLQIGDVLILQGKKEKMQASLSELGLLPLAERQIRLGKPRQIYGALIIFIVALTISAFNVLPIHITFSIAALAMILSKIVSLEEAYKSINWPIIFLLGAMIPVGLALEITGGSQFIASLIRDLTFIDSLVIILVLILIITMILTSLINSVAAVIIMAPVAINLALMLDVSIDPFLIVVLIGGASAFLTPIAHQSNLLVMGPGGYKFGDYWRLGIFIEIIIILVGIPLILLIFPF